MAQRGRMVTGFLICLASVAAAQAPLRVGDNVPKLPLEPVINGAFGTYEKTEVTVIDFFGTWCVPCLKALPHLASLRDSMGASLNVVLVSNEAPAQLERFVRARPGFVFPVLADAKGAWYGAFQPPSLPYTAVINSSGSIVALSDAASLTVNGLRAMAKDSAGKDKIASRSVSPLPATTDMQKSSNATVGLSQEFLYAAKTGSDIQPFLDRMAALSYDSLRRALQTDAQKKAFWINVYNGAIQNALRNDLLQYRSRRTFFGKKRIVVAGQQFSFDDIEHDLLRRSRIKWSLGHLGKPFVGRREKELRVDRIDHRIHFALNCGARSCPPIAFYADVDLDRQLDLATRSYLSSEASYDAQANLLRLPRLMSWFRADFGGKKGMIRLVESLGLVPEGAKPKIRFNEYDWSLTLNEYANLNP